MAAALASIQAVAFEITLREKVNAGPDSVALLQMRRFVLKRKLRKLFQREGYSFSCPDRTGKGFFLLFNPSDFDNTKPN